MAPRTTQPRRTRGTPAASDETPDAHGPDLDAFSRFATETLLNLPHVKDIHTSFSLGEVKSGAVLPLTHLQNQPNRAARR